MSIQSSLTTLVFDLEPRALDWTVEGPSGPPRRVVSPLADEGFLSLTANLREWASRPVPSRRPDPLGTETFLRELARRISLKLTETLFSAADRQAVSDALAKEDRVRLVIRAGISGTSTVDADSALALPWELLAPDENEDYPVRGGRLSILREAVTDEAPVLEEPSGPLTLAVTIAAPEDRAALPYESESFRLLSALAPLGQRAVFANLGELSDLADLVANVHATAIHFRGHGLPGGLFFEDALGFADEVSVAELRRRLAMVLLDPGRVGTFPGLFFLAAPFTARETEEVTSAAALHRSGFAQVIGFFGPVNAELNTRLEERFYGDLANGRSVLTAVEEARMVLAEPVNEAGEDVCYPFGWCQLAVYHRGPDLPLARPGQGDHEPLVQRHTVEISGLPVLEHGFIGRRGLQHEVRRSVERDGRRLVVIQGLGGLGKTALASQLLVRAFAPDPKDQLVLRCQELEDHPVLELRAQAEEHGRVHDLPFWEERVKDLRERVGDPATGLVEVIRRIREERPGLVVYVDNAETLQAGPLTDDPAALGHWRPGLEEWWAEMERLAEDDGCLLLVTTRYAWEGLSPRAHIGLPPMVPADSLRLIDSFEALRDLPLEVRVRLAERVDGHPRTVEFLDRLVAQRIEGIPNITHAWDDLIVPILSVQDDKIRTDLLLEKLWDRLTEEARQHARRLLVLRRPAPIFVVDRMGESRDELIRSGWLTRYRERVRGTSGVKWMTQWGMHALVREQLNESAVYGAGNCAASASVAAHYSAAEAWEAWIGTPNSCWEDHAEAIHHLHVLGEGDRAWPAVEKHVLWLRRGARYLESEKILTRCERAGTTGERLARALLFQVQMKTLGGSREESLTHLLSRAQELAETSETRTALLQEKANLFFELGDYAKAEERLLKIVDIHTESKEAASLSHAVTLHELGEVRKKKGRFREAEACYQQALEIRRQRLGEDHPAFVSALYALAGLFTRQDRFVEAETLLRQSLQIDGRVRGTGHPDYASSLHELAVVLSFQGHLTEAENLFRKALDILERTLGEHHPNTGATIHELARVLSDQGRYAQAVSLFRRCSSILAESVGTSHADHAVCLAELSSVLSRLGRYEESEKLLRQCLSTLEDSLGTDHPDLGAALQHLAFAVESLGRFEESEKILQQSLHLLQRSGEENRSSYAGLRHALGGLLGRQGRYVEAERTLRECLKMKAEIWGDSHQEYSLTLHELANALERQGKNEEAEELLRSSLRIKRQNLAPNHPSLLTTLQEIANVLSRRGQYLEAERLLRGSLEALGEALGVGHPDYGAALYSLSGILDAQGRFAEAEELLRRYLHMLESNARTKHPDYATSLLALAGVLSRRGSLDEAERLARLSAEVLRQSVGEEHPDFGITLHELAGIFFKQGRFDEAEDALRSALVLKDSTLGKEHPSYAASLHELGVVLQARGDLTEAQECLEGSAVLLARTVGEDHPHYASTLHALAGIFSRQHHYEEAEVLLLRSIEIKERVLGASHPLVVASLNNLANALVGQGRLVEAEPLFERAYELACEVHDGGGPEGARCLNLLAQVQSLIGRSEAPNTARKALEALHAFLGPNHPTTRASEPRLQTIAHSEPEPNNKYGGNPSNDRA